MVTPKSGNTLLINKSPKSGNTQGTIIIHPKMVTHRVPSTLNHTLQSASESGQEAMIEQIDFSAAFDWVNHQGILYKLCCVCIGGPAFSILTLFLFRPTTAPYGGWLSK